jgi:phosphatidylinositol-3-phosphatase
MKWQTRSVALSLLLLLAGIIGLSNVQRSYAVAPPLPAFSHVFTIVLENKEYTSVIGNSKAPYFNQLAQQYGLATQFYGTRHPSLPNYLALSGGDTFGITSDCTSCFVHAPSIVDQLEGAGKSWKAYMEGMPAPCFVGDSGNYRQKHNPFIYYDDIRTSSARCNRIVPFSQFQTDLSGTLPNYVWITPDMCNDEHDCGVDKGDAWLQTWVPRILASAAWQNGGALFITYDEGSTSAGCCNGQASGGHIATLVISPLARRGFQSSVAYDHYSLLRTIEDAWGLPALGKAASASPMSDFFGTASGSTPTATRFRTATAVRTETPGPQPTLSPPPPTRTPRPSPTAPAPGAATTLLPVADTYVRGGAWAKESFGTADELQVKDGSDSDYDRRAFLRFDLHTVSASITTATLRLFVSSQDRGPLTLAALTSDNWSEATLTWATQPQIGPELAITTIAGAGWVSLDVTTVVKQQLATDKQVSFALLDDTTARTLIRFSSREGANPPVLELH